MPEHDTLAYIADELATIRRQLRRARPVPVAELADALQVLEEVARGAAGGAA